MKVYKNKQAPRDAGQGYITGQLLGRPTPVAESESTFHCRRR